MKSLPQIALSAALLAATPLALSLSANPAHAAETAAQRAGRAAIAAQYRKIDAAIVRHDVVALVAHLAPDFKSHGPDGSVADRAQNEAALRAMLSGKVLGVKVKFIKSQSKILSLKWRGPDAIVQVQTNTVCIGGQGKKSVRSEVVGVSREYWGKTARGWQIRQSVTTQMKRWINGVRDPSM